VIKDDQVAEINALSEMKMLENQISGGENEFYH
jgi:hypothetical protein